MQKGSYSFEDVCQKLYERKMGGESSCNNDMKKVPPDDKKTYRKHLQSYCKLLGIDTDWLKTKSGRQQYSFSEKSVDFLVNILENAAEPQSVYKKLRQKKEIERTDLKQYIKLVEGFEYILQETDCPPEVIRTRIAKLHDNVNYDELIIQSILFEIDQMLHSNISEQEEPFRNIKKADQLEWLQWIRKNVICYIYKVKELMEQIRENDLQAIKEANEEHDEVHAKSNKEQANEYAALNRTLPVPAYRDAVEFDSANEHRPTTAQLADEHYKDVLDEEEMKDIQSNAYRKSKDRYKRLLERTADSLGDEEYCYMVAAQPSRNILEEAVNNIPYDYEIL